MAARFVTRSSFAIRAHPHLYEINTWAWLEELSVRLGRRITLAEVPDAEWDSLAQLGFNIMWLMGVWQRSPESRRIKLENPQNHPEFEAALPGWKPSDAIGSPYSIVDYVPDPRIGTWDSLDAVRQKLHARGMALFLDFVGNHTALDCPWTREHPEFYIQGTKEQYDQNPSAFYQVETSAGVKYLAFGKDPYFPPWDDVAQLNHFQPALRAAQLDILRTIASHCDGIRCDLLSAVSLSRKNNSGPKRTQPSPISFFSPKHIGARRDVYSNWDFRSSTTKPCMTQCARQIRQRSTAFSKLQWIIRIISRVSLRTMTKSVAPSSFPANGWSQPEL